MNRDYYGCKCGCGKNEINPVAVKKLDDAMGYAGFFFKLRAAYKCPDHDTEEGNHSNGCAFDVKYNNGEEYAKIVLGLLRAGFRRIGYYDNHIHADCCKGQPAPFMWWGKSR